MLAMKLWRCRCALVIAALLLVIPASAQDPADPDPDSEELETDESADPADLEESDSEETDSDLEEPDAADLGATLRRDMVEQASDIEEILITGEKTNTLQDAPTSSTSFSAGDLQALRIENISDLADYTPNLEINTAFAASNPTIFIRGIGLKDYNANAAGAVAVYQDGININSPAIQLGQLFDIDGIDVLRGPQGSVNGRNATAGAILIRSAMPDGEFGVTSSFTYGNYDDYEVEAAINIPLIEDMLSMRVSGTAQWRDGYTKNQCAGWDPTQLGFPTVDEESNSALYSALGPTGNWASGGTTPNLVLLNKANDKKPVKDTYNAMIWLNYDLARDVRNQTIGVDAPQPNKAWVLAETVINDQGQVATAIDVNGNPTPAVAGALVAAQGSPTLVGDTLFGSNTFSITDVDGVCMIHAPGNITTTLGEFKNPTTDTEGEWSASRIQPSLQDFAGLKPWTNNIDNWAARMVLLFEPMDNMEWMINAHGTQNRGDSAHLQMLGATALKGSAGFEERPEADFAEHNAALVALQNGVDIGEGLRNVPGVNPAFGPGEGGGNPHSGFYSSDGIEFIDAWGVNGRGFWDLGAVVVTLLYDYEWYDRVVEDEGDANPSRIFPAIWSDSAWQTTEELRFEGEGERYTWTGGFFFLHEELTANNFFPDTQQFQINQDFSQELTSWAPYLSGELDLVEEGVIPGIYELKLGGGVRYNQETKDFTLASSAIGTTSNVSVVELAEETVSATWKEWTGDVQLSYTPFSNEYGTLLSYLKYGRGFKGGHFNANLKITGVGAEQDIDPVEPEFIDSVEFGLRSRWFDDRVILNAAVFRYWYQDLQVFDITNEEGKLPIQKLLNADADVLGAEAELRVRPIPGLLISSSMGWLDSEFKEFTVTKVVGQPRGSPKPVDFDYTGNNLVAAPVWNFSVITEYEIPLFGWGSLIPQYDFNYRSKAYLDPQKIDPISQDPYWLHNARIAYRTPDDRIELSFWVSNLLEEEYKVDVFDLARQSNTILEVWGEPRTYGVTLSLNW
jgi:outer membrane receptor protein involved in Fe transport